MTPIWSDQNAHQWLLIIWYCWYGWSWMYETVKSSDSCYPMECHVLHLLAILDRSFQSSDLIGLNYRLFMFKRTVLLLYKATTLQLQAVQSSQWTNLKYGWGFPAVPNISGNLHWKSLKARIDKPELWTRQIKDDFLPHQWKAWQHQLRHRAGKKKQPLEVVMNLARSTTVVYRTVHTQALLISFPHATLGKKTGYR